MESEMDLSLSLTEFKHEIKTAKGNLTLFDEIVSWSQIRMVFRSFRKKNNKQSVPVWSFIKIFTLFLFFFVEAKFIQIQRKFVTQWCSQI